jgi:hypothetical protein
MSIQYFNIKIQKKINQTKSPSKIKIEKKYLTGQDGLSLIIKA